MGLSYMQGAPVDTTKPRTASAGTGLRVQLSLATT